MHDYNDIARRQRELAEESGGNSMAVNILAGVVQDAFETPLASQFEDEPICAARRRAEKFAEQDKQFENAMRPDVAKLPATPADLRQYDDETLDALADAGKIQTWQLIGARLERDRLVYNEDDLPESLQAQAEREAQEKAAQDEAALQEKVRKWFEPDFAWIERGIREGREHHRQRKNEHANDRR